MKAIPVCAYNETSKYIYLPKAYGLSYFGIPPKKRVLYKQVDIDIDFTKSLRPI